tara:strand:- start:818 stop:1603 length:786 start_codon:yes stop_codon:yes gene_type:complete
MNTILFSLAIGLILSLTYNYISLVKLKHLLIFILIDTIILSAISYAVISTSNLFKEKSLIPLALLFLSFIVSITYLLLIRDKIYFKFLIKQRLEKTENIVYQKLNKKVEIYTNNKITGIRVLQNKRKIIISTKIANNLNQKDICNIIALNLNKNIVDDSLFVILYFIPAIIFYYSATYTEGSVKTSLVLFASSLIFILKRYINNSRINLDIKNLQNKIEKNELIESIKQYSKISSANLSNIQKSINQYKMNKSIEAINKLL